MFIFGRKFVHSRKRKKTHVYSVNAEHRLNCIVDFSCVVSDSLATQFLFRRVLKRKKDSAVLDQCQVEEAPLHFFLFFIVNNHYLRRFLTSIDKFPPR